MGTAAVQGELWGAKASDWAKIQEPSWRPVFKFVLTTANVGPGTRLLDVGCGSGGLLALAHARGAAPAGLDASEALVTVARERLPTARIEVGDMENLPFADGEFDVVTGINAFQFADDTEAALSEAGRVCRRDGTVLMLVWGERQKCELLAATGSAIGPLLPTTAGPTTQPFANPGFIEDLMRRSGLRATDAGELDALLTFPNLETAVRAVSSSGIATRAERHSGAEEVAGAITVALRPFARADGSVRLANQFRWVTATPERG